MNLLRGNVVNLYSLKIFHLFYTLIVDDDGVLREVWFGLGLSPLLTLLTNNPRFPTNPDEYIVLDKFEAPPNAGDGYGQRLSTYYKVTDLVAILFRRHLTMMCQLGIIYVFILILISEVIIHEKT